MTVKELRKTLENLPDNDIVYNGYGEEILAAIVEDHGTYLVCMANQIGETE